MDNEELLCDVADGVAVVTLNRPAKRNALSGALMGMVASTIQSLEADPQVRAVILTGADPAFSAGFDLRNLGAELANTRLLNGALTGYGLLPPHTKPVLGAVNGPAVTGGLELALSCDFLIASERASFADTHARVGVMPGGGMTIRLPALIGVDRARRMSLTGDFIDAATALAWGLVVEVTAHDQLLDRARALAASIASIDPEPVAALREMYDEIGALTGDAAWEAERTWNRRWMKERFDPAALSTKADAIIERGSRQN